MRNLSSNNSQGKRYQLTINNYLLLFFSVVALLLAACTTGATAGQTAATPSAVAVASATPTVTPPPPPPRVEYTPVPLDTLSPIIVQRFPRRGETLAPNGTIELIFDRGMNESATESAFTLLAAAEPPATVAGAFAWQDEGRTLVFTPAESLAQAATYDVVLTQAAQAADGAPLAEPFTFRFSTPGYLEVSQVIPADGTDNVETGATITVMFNRPVVPLTSLAEAENFPQPVEFEPALSGAGEWLNTSIYVFTPTEPIPGGTTVTAQVKSGLTDAAGQTLLPADFTWRFTTQPPEVVFTNPSDGQTLVPIERPVQVTFNQPVDPQSAVDHFELSGGGGLLGGGAVSGDFNIVDNTLTFTPTERLAFDTTYQVTVEAGVTAAAGGQGMVSPYSFSFTTVPLPRIVGTEPSDGQADVWPYTDFRIIFNAPINPATVMAHVAMTPPLPITPTLVYTYYSPWDNTFSFSFDSKPSTDYEVRLSPGIEDPYGNTTRENLTVRFRTAPLDPYYQLRTSDLVGTYDAALPATLFVGYVNINTLNLNLYRLDPQLIFRPTWEWNDYEPNSADLIRQWTERLEAPADEQSFQPIDLVEGGGRLEPGLYYLSTESPQVSDRYFGGNRHVLVVTETNLTLKAGQKDALVWATDLATGRPMAGQEVTFFDDNNRQLG
ncbi:MAG: Ig-like domain-containing protein, partial [Anaerolineae bacterium]|nr:Ig-like domain-containing protein [Anaerolineae bacterium]